jgi:RNA polymerase sigma-70 factor, ECF subfamily
MRLGRQGRILTALFCHLRETFGICLRVLGNRAEAEDALQDVFVKIWRNAERYQVNGLSPMTWLITIARNLSIDRLRARKTA